MRRWGIYESSSDFDKLAGQGAYDNLHLAPRMKFTSKVATGPTIPDIVMAPFCIHDCFHTHTRWGTLNGGLPESNQGFSGRVPYQVSGAPLVPGNQTVWISLTKTGSTTGFEYRGSQAGTILPGTWSVINHHGSAYALEVTGTTLVSIARTFVGSLVQGFHEPYTSPDLASDAGDWDIDDVDPTVSWAAFYQRLQYTGDAATNTWQPRIKILDLAKCRNG